MVQNSPCHLATLLQVVVLDASRLRVGIMSTPDANQMLS
jgi:hypothetical protein